MDRKTGKKQGRPARRSAFGPASTFLLRLPDTLKGPIRTYAGAQGMSVNDALVELITDGWSRVKDRETYARLAAEASAPEARKKGGGTR